MCFEFEALYWAKLAEEEDKKKEAEKQRKAVQAAKPAKPEEVMAAEEIPLTV
jgi:hypothetical protein